MICCICMVEANLQRIIDAIVIDVIDVIAIWGIF